MKKFHFSALAGLFLGVLSLSLSAAQFTTVGDYVIHYNAINTSILTTDVAKQYKLSRSKHRGLLNISVRKKGSAKNPQDHAVAAKVSATATNLNGQLQNIKIKEVREGEAIYYIGEVRIDNAETLNFKVDVDAEHQGKTHEIKFKQEFFID